MFKCWICEDKYVDPSGEELPECVMLRCGYPDGDFPEPEKYRRQTHNHCRDELYRLYPGHNFLMEDMYMYLNEVFHAWKTGKDYEQTLAKTIDMWYTDIACELPAGLRYFRTLAATGEYETSPSPESYVGIFNGPKPEDCDGIEYPYDGKTRIVHTSRSHCKVHPERLR